jgi:hypothetical protein
MAQSSAEDQAVTMSISKSILITALLAASTHSPAQTCLSGMPESLRSVVEQDQWTIVQPQNLSESDLTLWNRSHPGQCPGVATGNPFSKTNRYFIVALIHPDGPNSLIEQVLLVTRKKNRPVTEEAVPMRLVSTPHVVWLQKDRYFQDITASRDSFIYERVSGPASQLIIQDSQIKSFLPLETRAVAPPPPQPATKPTTSSEALLTPPID